MLIYPNLVAEMSLDLLQEAFFFLSRGEAENLRLVCRDFDSFCTKRRDVHGYKLEVYSLSIGRTDSWASGPGDYIAYVEAYGRFQKIRGTEQQMSAGLKAALAVSLVHHCRIHTSALCETSAASLRHSSLEFRCEAWISADLSINRRPTMKPSLQASCG